MTKKITLLTISLVAVLQSSCKPSQTDPDLSLPLMGVLYQPGDSHFTEYFDPASTISYVLSSYVRWVEQGGGIAVLIPFDLPEKEIVNLLDAVQGVFLPGGILDNFPGGKPAFYMRRTKFVVDYAIARNNKGDYFPIIGNCQGHEQIAQIFAGMYQNVTTCGADNDPNQATMVKGPGYVNSKFWNELDQELVTHVFEKDGVLFLNECCVQIDDFNKYLASQFELVATSTTKNGIDFVAIMEHKQYPIFTVQWHPEKIQYEKLANFSYLNRTPSLLRLMRDLITLLVEKTKPQAQPLSSIGGDTRRYMSFFQPARRVQEANQKGHIIMRTDNQE